MQLKNFVATQLLRFFSVNCAQGSSAMEILPFLLLLELAFPSFLRRFFYKPPFPALFACMFFFHVGSCPPKTVRAKKGVRGLPEPKRPPLLVLANEPFPF